jgi:hypothetical protein
LLLAQNRQDDRDKVSLQQDRQRAERNLSDTEYLTRELASLRIALREVATRDYVRAELRSLLEDMHGGAGGTARPTNPSAGAHETPREKVKEKMKERRDKSAQSPYPADPPGQGRRKRDDPAKERRTLRRTLPDPSGKPPNPSANHSEAAAESRQPAHRTTPES